MPKNGSRVRCIRLGLAGLAVAMAAALLVSVSPVQSQAQTAVEIGVLSCDVDGSIGLIVGSRRQMTCTFERADGGPFELYTGTITRFGLDIGVTGEARIVWVVFAPTTDPGRGRLAGGYAGVSAEASLFVGLGANALVGGFERSFALQPLSVQTQQGLNIAAGVTGLELRSAE